MSIAEIRELFATALTWVDGDTDRAKLLVSAYLKGRVDWSIIESGVAA